MTTYFDRAQPAKFGTVFFPVADISVSSTQRHQVHEYPHTPGGALEKLGRKVYTFRVTPILDEGIRTYTQMNGGIRLYPDVLTILQKLYEEETSAPLTLPTVGTVFAFMTSFSRKFDANLRSGERVELEFVEDQTQAFKAEAVARRQETDVPAAFNDYAKLRAAGGYEEDIFDKIDKLANKAFGAVDRLDRASNRIGAKFDNLSQLIMRAETKIDRFQHPENWRALEALKELAAAAQSAARTASFTRRGPKKFNVPKKMTIQQVSLAVYQSTDRTLDLLRMNDIADSLDIPAGTQIRYLP